MALLWSGGKAQGIVASCDLLLSGQGASVHGPFAKIVRIGRTWVLGYSGLPGHFSGVFAPMQRLLAATPELPAEAVVKALQDAYFSERQRHVEASILSPYRLTLQQFLTDGLAIFGEKKFEQLTKRIESYDLGIDLILGGWCPGALHDPRILTLSHPGSAYNHAVEGSSAIGAGAPIALGHLDACHNIMGSMEYALYQTMVAKMMSEAERSVGPDTVLMALDRDGNGIVIDNEDCERFRKLWEVRRRETPQELMETLKQRPGAGYAL